jgi:hypothetical protein
VENLVGWVKGSFFKQRLARLRESPDRFGVSVAYEIYQYFTAAGEKAALELIDRVAKEP